MRFQRALIVGASSGIGREMARQLAQEGTKVAVLSRRMERLEELAVEFPGLILPYTVDVKETAGVPEFFQRICADLGGLDLFVYNSGVMTTPAEPTYDWPGDEGMIQVNVTGAVRWTNEAAERFGALKTGTLVGIGSVAGDRGRYLNPVYNASKAFLHTYLESLRNRLGPEGVRVVTIKPGPVRTEMTVTMKWKKAMSAETAAAIALNKMSRGGEHYLSPVHWLAFRIIQNLPSGVMQRLKF
ncbi:MAG: short-chain dehydrogenase [Armatimonadota bacterium]